MTEVTTTLYVDVNPGARRREHAAESSVYLRNQNRKPTAVFSLALANAGTAIIMNASESTDPEEKPLDVHVVSSTAPRSSARARTTSSTRPR